MIAVGLLVTIGGYVRKLVSCAYTHYLYNIL